MPELPLNIQSFRKIRENGLLYVDKTRDIHRLVTSYRNPFLARPRLFGKSLLLDTIAEVFKGRRELFKGLHIESEGYKFPQYPVVKLTFSELDASSPERFIASLNAALSAIAIKEEVNTTAPYCGFILNSLLDGLKKKYKSDVVLLVDDYDAPITRHLDNLDLATANHQALQLFFDEVKNIGEYGHNLHFFMVTGSSRLGVANYDVGTYNLFDISISQKYFGICGFTVNELDQYFGDRMEETYLALENDQYFAPGSGVEDLRAELLRWYHGYSFGEIYDFLSDNEVKHVMNPHSILNFFANNRFDNYWFQNGWPLHLTEFIKRNPMSYIRPSINNRTSKVFWDSSLTGGNSVGELFNSGHLTIGKTFNAPIPSIITETESNYNFKFPNFEIESSYQQAGLKSIFGQAASDYPKRYESVRQIILTKDGPNFTSFIKSVLSDISYHEDFDSKGFIKFFQFLQYDYYYSVVQSAFLAMGFETRNDLHCLWLVDMGIILPDDFLAILTLYHPQGVEPRNQAKIDHSLADGLEHIRSRMKNLNFVPPFYNDPTKIIKIGLVISGPFDDARAEFIN